MLFWMKERKKASKPVGNFFLAARDWRLTVWAVVGGEEKTRHLNLLSSVKYCVGRAGGLTVSPPFYAAPGTRWDTEGGAGRWMPCGARDGRSSFSRPVVDWPRGVYFWDALEQIQSVPWLLVRSEHQDLSPPDLGVSCITSWCLSLLLWPVEPVGQKLPQSTLCSHTLKSPIMVQNHFSRT